MIVNKDRLKIGVMEIAAIILSLLFVIGIRTWFAVCPVTGDTPMTCHWAGEMLKILSILILVLSVTHTVIPDEKIKVGMDAALACTCAVTAFVPGGIIGLCKSADMACRKTTYLWTVGICVLLVITFAVDIYFCITNLSREKHRRKEL